MEGGYFENINKDIVIQKHSLLKNLIKEKNNQGEENPDYIIDVNNAQIKFNKLMTLLQRKVNGNGELPTKYTINKIFKILDNYYNTLLSRTEILKEDYIILDSSNNYIYSNILELNPVDISNNIVKSGTTIPKPIFMYRINNFEITPILNTQQKHKQLYSAELYTLYQYDIGFNIMFLDINKDVSEHLYDVDNSVIPIDADRNTIYNQMILSDIIKLKIQEGYSLISDDFLKKIREINGINKLSNVENLCDLLYAFDNTLTIRNTPIKTMFNANCIDVFLKILHHDQRPTKINNPDLNREIRLQEDNDDTLAVLMQRIQELLGTRQLETELENIKSQINRIGNDYTQKDASGNSIRDESGNTIKFPYDNPNISELITLSITEDRDRRRPENPIKDILYKILNILNNELVQNNNLKNISKYESLLDLNDKFTDIKNFALFNNIKEYIKNLLYITQKENNLINLLNNNLLLTGPINYEFIDKALDTLNFDTNFKRQNNRILQDLLNQYNTVRNQEINDTNRIIKKLGNIFELCIILDILNNIDTLDNEFKQNITIKIARFFRDIEAQFTTSTSSGAAGASGESEDMNIEQILALTDENLNIKSISVLDQYKIKLESAPKGPLMKQIQPFLKRLKAAISTKPKEDTQQDTVLQKLTVIVEQDYMDINLQDYITQKDLKLQNNNKIINFMFEIFKDLYSDDVLLNVLVNRFIQNQCYENIILTINREEVNYIKICDNIFLEYLESIITNFETNRRKYNLSADITEIFSNRDHLNNKLRSWLEYSKLGDEVINYEIENKEFRNYETKNMLKKNIDDINTIIKKPLYIYSFNFLLGLIKLLFNIYKTDRYFIQNSEGTGVGTMIAYIYIIKYFSQNMFFHNKRQLLAKIYNDNINNIIKRSSEIIYRDQIQNNNDQIYTAHIPFIINDNDYNPNTDFINFMFNLDSPDRLQKKRECLNSLYYNNFVKKMGYKKLQYMNFNGWADCTETAIRNLINTLIYDEKTDSIKPELLPETMIPEFKNFFKIYNLETQTEQFVYQEWRTLFNNHIKTPLRTYLLNLDNANRWTSDNFAYKIWHYDRGAMEQQDMRSNFINFTNVLSLIIYGIGYMDNIISDNYDLTINNEALNRLKERCTQVIENIIRPLIPSTETLSITFTENTKINIKYLNYIFYSRIGHSDLDLIVNIILNLKKVNNLMSIYYKKLYTLSIYNILNLNKIENSICKKILKNSLPLINFVYKYIQIRRMGEDEITRNDSFIMNFLYNMRLYNFIHHLILCINNINEIKKLTSLFMYGYQNIFNKILLVYIRLYIVENTTTYNNITYPLENQYYYMNISIFDAFIEYANAYNNIDDIIDEYYLRRGEVSVDIYNYFNSIHNMILKMKRLTLNFHKLNRIFRIFNFSISQNNIFIIDQLLCIKNIAKYHVETKNLDNFKIIIDKIINENINNLENLIKHISYFYIMKDDSNPDDLDLIIFEIFIEKIKTLNIANKYNFDILKLLENFAANILITGGLYETNELEVPLNDLKIITNNDFQRMIYNKPILQVNKHFQLIKDIIYNINITENRVSENIENIDNHSFRIAIYNALIVSQETKDRNYDNINQKYNELDITQANLDELNARSMSIMTNSILNKRNIIQNILNKIIQTPDLIATFTNIFKQRSYNNKIYFALYANNNINNNLNDPFYDTENNKPLILQIHQLISNHIASYAKYIITQILSVPEERLSFRFYNSNTIQKNDLEQNLHNTIDNIINETFDATLLNNFQDIINFSKEYKVENIDILANQTIFFEKIINNNLHVNILLIIVHRIRNSNIINLIINMLLSKLYNNDYKIDYIFKIHIIHNLMIKYYYVYPLPPQPIEILQQPQQLVGGNKNNKYYSKYMKYKQKYLMLQKLM